MRTNALTEHVYQVSLGMVNVFVIVHEAELTLIDAGYPRNWPKVEQAIRGLGHRPDQVKDILVTHLHSDHTGGLADAQRATGARVWMHPADAELVRAGIASRPWKRAPGSLFGRVAEPFFGDRITTIAPVRVIVEVVDRQEIPAAGGILPVWTPGHTEGHTVYLWPLDEGVLFVGDAASRGLRLQTAPLYENYERGLASLRLISNLDFQTACISHWRSMVGGAQDAFRTLWPAG
jgi:glyoxylase-like metal-dependent hydrolase (beta-lactamase superfamily II)